MYEGSCTSCKQIYNLSQDDEEIQSELIHEELEEEEEDETKIKLEEATKIEEYEEGTDESEGINIMENLSLLDSLDDKPPVYDGNNFVPEVEDLYLEDDEGNEFHFDEQLYMINRESKERDGSMNITVEHLEKADFFVIIHIQFSDGSKCYEVYNYGYVRKNFESTEEARFEIEIDPENEKCTVHSLYARPAKGKYLLTEQYRYNIEHLVKNKTALDYNDFVNVTTESANIILMRQIARKNFVGYKFVKSLITNREVCETQLKCYPFVWCTVNDKSTELKRIRKRVITPSREVQESNAYLTRNGQIALVMWCGETHYAAIGPEVEFTPGYHPKDPNLLNSFLTRFLNRPETKRKIELDTNRLVLQSKNYIADHPEVMAIISYICKQILLTKPHKVILFVKRCILPYL